MKILSILSFVALTGLAGAQTVLTERITPEQFAAMKKPSPLDNLPQTDATAEKQVLRSGDQSIIRQSDILTDGTHWTLVPKGAVLHVPAAMASRVGSNPAGKLLPWMDFLVANRAWISTEETSFDQAAGKVPLLAERRASWQKFNKVVVAVHQGGPISVIVPEKPATTTTATAAATAKTPQVTQR